MLLRFKPTTADPEIGWNLGGGGGGGVSESMDGRGCAILALKVVPKNLIFT